MTVRSAIRPFLVLALLLGLTAPAGAQVASREGIALQNQILELQHQIAVFAGAGRARR